MQDEMSRTENAGEKPETGKSRRAGKKEKEKKSVIREILS